MPSLHRIGGAPTLRGLCLLLALAGGQGRAHAQSLADTARYVRRQWTTADGLPVNGLTSLLQGRDGYLWITSWDGLIRFDGVRFTVYNRSTTPGIPSNRLLNLAEDRTGLLFVRTDQGKLFTFQRGRATLMGPAQGLRGEGVTMLHRDPSGGLVAATEAGLFEWDGHRFVQRWQAAPGAHRSGFAAVAMHGSLARGLWIGTYGDGLLYFAGGRMRQWTHISGRPVSYTHLTLPTKRIV